MIPTTVKSKNIKNTVNLVFANHETFHPRFGWLKKGFDAATKNPEIFLQDDAPVSLGVGKNIDCPFSELGLIRSFGKNYQFKIGAKTNLPASIIVATCLEYASWVSQQTKTIAISRLLYDEGSPGMVFKLTENVLCEAIETVAKRFDSIIISNTAGLIQLYFTNEPKILAEEILEHYYNY